MAGNDVIILDSMLDKRKKEIAEDMRNDDFFELFSFEQILKNNDVSYEELESGRIGSGDDGGIDGFFLFVNEELVDDDYLTDNIKRNPKISLILVQAKQSSTFTETAIDKVISTLSQIFNLNVAESELQKIYNNSLVTKVQQFKKVYLDLSAKHPQLYIKFVYTSKGNTSEIHPKVREKSRAIQDTINNCFSGVNSSVDFIGARELLETARTEKSYTLQLKFLENYISRDEDNYVILSKITDYCDFVSDNDGTLRKYIFDANVRDYQGQVEVNKDIKRSLETDDGLDFWYLNNGVTILASRASIAGKTITLDDIQIVNGLQTTNTIFNYLSENSNRTQENRGILIKIIVTKNPEARDKIIKATNNQTFIPTASLRATDKIQRDIEDYMLNHGWFYDRRKNYYKNLGKPSNKIVGIPYLAQCVMAIILKEPDNARARPSSLIKQDSEYERVFNNSISFQTYLTCASIIKDSEHYLKSQELSDTSYSQFKFHFGMLMVINGLGKMDYSNDEVAEIINKPLPIDIYLRTYSEFIEKLEKFKLSRKWGNDRIAKTREFVTFLIGEET